MFYSAAEVGFFVLSPGRWRCSKKALSSTPDVGTGSAGSSVYFDVLQKVERHARKKSLRKTGLYSNVALEHFHCSQVGFY